MIIRDVAQVFTGLGRAVARYPDAPWEDALSHGQMQSKAWAVGELARLKRDLGTVYIVGGWLGTLGALLSVDRRMPFRVIRSFDIDPSCQPIADQVNEHAIDGWRFKAVTKDMLAIDYHRHRYQIPTSENASADVEESPDTIINTACDHVADFGQWWSLIPMGKLVLLQNNNFHEGSADHVNVVDSLEAFQAQAPMTETLLASQLENPKFRRFMVIGIR